MSQLTIDNGLLGSVEPPPPGIYPGVPAATYRAWAAVNASLLKECRRSMAHGRAYLARPDRLPTDAMRLGSALHVWALERARYGDAVRVIPDFSSRSKAGAMKLAQLTDAGVTPVAEDEDDRVRRMSLAIGRHPYARRLAASPGQVEAAIVWRDEASGLTCKARCDKWWRLPEQPRDLAIDLKSTADASDESFPRDVAKYGYHLQAAFYLRALRAVTGRDAPFLFVAVESVEPHGVRVAELGEATLTEGDRLCGALLKGVAAAVAGGEWPGYSAGVDVIEIPQWAFVKGDFRE